MNADYISFIPKLFYNAKVIIDRFHIIQLFKPFNEQNTRSYNESAE